jgi:hypothetical protein
MSKEAVGPKQWIYIKGNQEALVGLPLRNFNKQ